MHRATRGGLNAGEEEDFINIAGLFRKHRDSVMIVVLTACMQLPVITSCVLAVMRTPLLCVWLEVQRYLTQT